MVVEPVSRWSDAYGTSFDNGFLDWAFVTELNLIDTTDWSQALTWDGSEVGYGDITESNVAVVAVLYNDNGQERDALPPYGHYFMAYPVDAAVMVPAGSSGGSGSSDSCSHRTVVEIGLNHT
jgi:hypothetical protein